MLRLPENLEKILDKSNITDLEYLGKIGNILNDLNNLLIERNFLNNYFFPEYTDHGLNHITCVLNTASELIHPESIRHLNGLDVYILVGAVVCHDIAMNLTYEAFKSFISEDDVKNGEKKYKDLLPLYKQLNKEANSWENEWQNFIIEQKSNPNIIEESFHPLENTELPSREHLNEQQRKVIGEFIRRNHARLAFEVAILGIRIDGKYHKVIPKDDDEMDGKLNFEYKKLIGVAAWSHNYNINDTFNFLKINFAGKSYGNPLGCSIVYIMGLLRIADSLQVSLDRTGPFKFFKFKSIKNPISLKEFEKHQRIMKIHTVNYRTGVLNIDVNLECAEDFKNADITISNIKNEIHHSKEYLYFFYGNSNEFRFKYDEIQSNIYSESYCSNLSFQKTPLTLKTNNSLYQSLIGPLYQSLPKFGIRELLQNAVDACRYRKQVIKKNEKNEIYIPKVKITFNNNFLEIVDNGVGMDSKDIENYYLYIGKSSKLSNDSFGMTGRFGIGALASFLIGRRVYIETKKINQTEILSFEITDDKLDSIQLNYLSEKHLLNDYGTLIRVYFENDNNNESFNEFINNPENYLKENYEDFYWYVEQEVEIKLPDNIIQMKQTTNFTDLNYEEFEDVKIAFKDNSIALFSHGSMGENKIYSNLIVNGFRFDGFNNQETKPILSAYIDYNSLIIKRKNVSGKDLKISLNTIIVDDQFNKLPIKLDRSGLDLEKLDFSKIINIFIKHKIKSFFDDKIYKNPFFKNDGIIFNRLFNPSIEDAEKIVNDLKVYFIYSIDYVFLLSLKDSLINYIREKKITNLVLMKDEPFSSKIHLKFNNEKSLYCSSKITKSKDTLFENGEHNLNRVTDNKSAYTRTKNSQKIEDGISLSSYFTIENETTELINLIKFVVIKGEDNIIEFLENSKLSFAEKLIGHFLNNNDENLKNYKKITYSEYTNS